MFSRPIAQSLDSADQPVFITGVPRCGSSWVGEVLSSSAGVRYVYEPFNLNWVPELQGHLSYFKYLDAQSDVSPVVQRMAENAFKGLQGRKQLLRAAYRGYWKAATRSASRVILKDPTAPLMAEWVAKRFNARILIIMRHPCGFASSLEELDWEIRVDYLLRQNALMREHIGCYEDILRRSMGDKWLNRGAFWAAVHKVLNHQMRNHVGWQLCKYEDICSDPVGGFSSLADKLGLEIDGRLLEKTKSGNTKPNTDPGSTRRNSSKMPDIWRQRMSPAQVDAVMGVVNEFAATDYTK